MAFLRGTNCIGANVRKSLVGFVAIIAILSGANGVSSNHQGEAHSNLRSAEANPGIALPASLAPNYAAHARNLRHWDRRTVTVYVQASPQETRNREATLTQVGRGLTLWNARIGSSVALVLTDEADADIVVSFVAPKSLPGEAVGRTDVAFRMSDQVLTHANIRLTGGLSDDELVQVVAHETGHALGIQGHSNDKHDLMYPYAHLPAEVTDRDFNTIALSYHDGL